MSSRGICCFGFSLQPVEPAQTVSAHYQLLYAVPSLEFWSLPLCTSMIPGCDWSGDMMLSSVTGTQLSRVFVKGSLGSSFRYPASTRSCSDCGAFCLSNVY